MQEGRARNEETAPELPQSPQRPSQSATGTAGMLQPGSSARERGPTRSGDREPPLLDVDVAVLRTDRDVSLLIGERCRETEHQLRSSLDYCIIPRMLQQMPWGPTRLMIMMG